MVVCKLVSYNFLCPIRLIKKLLIKHIKKLNVLSLRAVIPSLKTKKIFAGIFCFQVTQVVCFINPLYHTSQPNSVIASYPYLLWHFPNILNFKKSYVSNGASNFLPRLFNFWEVS